VISGATKAGSGVVQRLFQGAGYSP
jgi:hypothetical protein